MTSNRTKAEIAYLCKLGKQIRKIRENMQLSQEDLADKSGLDRTYISDIERGERNVSVLNIRKIAKALKTHPSQIFTDT